MSEIWIPVSIGELYDKITILKIKKNKLLDEKKTKNVVNELEVLEKISSSLNDTLSDSSIKNYIIKLFDVNSKLWEIEEKKRQKEKLKQFDSEFIELSRSVYIFNDKRAAIKKKINLITKSSIIEEKSYVQ